MHKGKRWLNSNHQATEAKTDFCSRSNFCSRGDLNRNRQKLVSVLEVIEPGFEPETFDSAVRHCANSTMGW